MLCSLSCIIIWFGKFFIHLYCIFHKQLFWTLPSFFKSPKHPSMPPRDAFISRLRKVKGIYTQFSPLSLKSIKIFTILSFSPNFGKYVQTHLTDFHWGHTTSQAFYKVWIWQNQWPQTLNPWPYLAVSIEDYRYEPKIEIGCFTKMSRVTPAEGLTKGGNSSRLTNPSLRPIIFNLALLS